MAKQKVTFAPYPITGLDIIKVIRANEAAALRFGEIATPRNVGLITNNYVNQLPRVSLPYVGGYGK